VTRVRAGRSRSCGSFPGIRKGFISTKLSDRLWAPHSLSFSGNRGRLLWMCSGQNMKLTTHLRLVKVKVKWSRYRPDVTQRVGTGIALLFHDRGTRRGWVVSSTRRPRFTPRKDPVPILQQAGWAPGPLWTCGKSRPHHDSIPDRPARSQSSPFSTEIKEAWSLFLHSPTCLCGMQRISMLLNNATVIT